MVMNNMDPTVDIIYKYFPTLTEKQRQQFAQLEEVYRIWNNQINVISRKYIDSLYFRHVYPALGSGMLITAFTPGTRILDVGTVGAFPGIPLGILFREVQFHLVDSIGKKIKVVREVAKALGVEHVEAGDIRAEQLDYRHD